MPHTHRATSSLACRGRLPGASTLAGLALLFGVAACASKPVPTGLGIPWGATVQAIAANPVTAEGKLVTVSGEVNRVFGPRWFSIGGEDFGGPELLVVGSSRLPALLDRMADSGRVTNDIVQVTGRVRLFDVDAIEKEIGADLKGDEWWRPFATKPVVVMTSIAVSPRVDIVPPVAVAVPVAPVTDVLVITAAPDRRSLAGRAVALWGVKVQTVTGKRTFWVGPSADRQLFVTLSPTAAANLDVRPGQVLDVAGVLRALPADLGSVRSAWSLSGANEATLSREQIYLDASTVRVIDAVGARDGS